VLTGVVSNQVGCSLENGDSNVDQRGNGYDDRGNREHVSHPLHSLRASFCLDYDLACLDCNLAGFPHNDPFIATALIERPGHSRGKAVADHGNSERRYPDVRESDRPIPHAPRIALSADA